MKPTMILLTVLIFALALAGMAIGVILSNRRLKGSCGGMAGRQDADGNLACDICSTPSPECTGEVEGEENNSAERKRQ